VRGKRTDRHPRYIRPSSRKRGRKLPILQAITKNNKVAKSDIMGDFNAVIENNKSADNIGTFGETTCNNNGVKLIDWPFIMI
jgi:hypothetical protein